MLAEITFTNFAIVAAVAFLTPLTLALAPRLRLPSLVVELIAGIVIGPQVLGWAEIDTAVQVMALVGVAFLLFLAGLEIEFSVLRGQVLKLTTVGWILSFAIAIAIGFALDAGDIVSSPLLIAIILSATALGVIIPILKDAGVISTPFGQVVVAGASIAEVATVVLLSIFFGESEGGLGSRFLLFGGFVLLVVAAGAAIVIGEHVNRLSGAFFRLMDTTAQIRVRGAFLLLAIFVVAASELGLEAILGAFLAGAILKLTDRDGHMTHSGFHHKLEAVGFGVFIPFFWVASGLRFDVDALFSSGSTLAKVPLFLAALLLARGVPALLYRKLVGPGRVLPAVLLQSTSLSFIVVATGIGVELGLVTEGTAAAFVAAGLLSVLIFPLASLVLLKRREEAISGAVATVPS
jgi:Kef-type K+ transport system membrane component KefB